MKVHINCLSTSPKFNTTIDERGLHLYLDHVLHKMKANVFIILFVVLKNNGLWSNKIALEKFKKSDNYARSIPSRIARQQYNFSWVKPDKIRVMSDEELLSMMFFVDNVVGEIPK